jgi:hypothetical protein
MLVSLGVICNLGQPQELVVQSSQIKNKQPKPTHWELRGSVQPRLQIGPNGVHNLNQVGQSKISLVQKIKNR